MLIKQAKTIVVILLSVLIGVVVTLIIQLLVGPTSPPEDKQHEPAILFWYDPMYPDKKFDKPGPSPFMDMDLVPKYADGVNQKATGVSINPTQLQNLGLRTAVVKIGKLYYTQNLPANITFNQYQYQIIHARASGFVEKSYPITIGDYVKKGDPLVDITVSDWVGAQSEYLTLLKTHAPAELLKGVRDRLYLAGMPKELLDKLQQTKQIQSYLTLYAPISGVLTSFDVRSGMTVNKSGIIGTIQGIDPIWVTASLPESLLGLLSDKVNFTVSVSAFPDQVFQVTDWTILSDAQAETRTISIRLLVDNPRQSLKPGMSASVQLKIESTDYLLIPSQAVIDSGEQQRVIVQDDNGTFVPKRIKIFRESNGETAILSGLQAGEKVVTSGIFLIDSEANISGALDRLHQEDQL